MHSVEFKKTCCTFILFENAVYKVIRFALNCAVHYAAKSIREQYGILKFNGSSGVTVFYSLCGPL